MEKTKGCVEKHGDSDDDRKLASAMDDLPFRFYQFFVMTALRIDLIQPGRILCSLKVPDRLLVCFSLSFFYLFFAQFPLNHCSLFSSIHLLMRFLLPFSIWLLISCLLLDFSLLRTRIIPCAKEPPRYSSIV